MPDIEILGILTINCNTVDTQEADKSWQRQYKYSQWPGFMLLATLHKHEEANRPENCYTNTDSNLISKSNNEDKPMVNINEINYFLLREQTLKPHSSYKEILKIYLMEFI